MTTTLQQYLGLIQKQLPGKGTRKARILYELETHLLESWEQEQEQGISADVALSHVLERFGSPTLIGQEFARLEAERRQRLGQQWWQRACLSLAPLLSCYLIAALAFLGDDAPRLAFIHFTDSLWNLLVLLHLWLIGVLLAGLLILGGPAVSVISGTMGMITLKGWSRLTWLNLMCVMLGLFLLLFGLYSLATG